MKCVLGYTMEYMMCIGGYDLKLSEYMDTIIIIIESVD